MAYQKLKEFYAVFDGIPVENINLQRFRTRKAANRCDTIACAGGWAAMHPDFQIPGFTPRLGLGAAQLYWLNKETGTQLTAWQGLCEIFDLEPGQAGSIFASSPQAPQYHKEIWKSRVKRFLRDPNCFMPGYGLGPRQPRTA